MSSPLPITRYRLNYQVIQTILWPEYAGSALRGALGHALKKIACRHPEQENCPCPPQQPCLYRQLFDPHPQALLHPQPQDVPAPLVIEPGSHGQTEEAGQTGHFDLVVIGVLAHQNLPLLELAWQLALQQGVGLKHRHGRRGTAHLLGMTALDRPEADPQPPGSPLTLHLLSPLRLQHQQRWVTPGQLSPRILIQAISRRQQLVSRVYAVEEQTLPPPLPFALIDSIGLHEHTQWMSWTRWSNRQHREMSLDGLTGTLQLHPVPAGVWPTLYLGQWLHVGKNSMFGLGHYRLEAGGPAATP